MSVKSNTPDLQFRIGQIRLRRLAMVARLESLMASADEVRHIIEDLDDILAAIDASTKNVHVQPVSVAASPTVGSPTVRASGNPKKEVIAQEAHAYIKAAGRPLTRREIFEKLSDNGFVIRGSNPEMVLSTMLWRAGADAGIERLKSGGYDLKTRSNNSDQFEDLIGDPTTKPSGVFD